MKLSHRNLHSLGHILGYKSIGEGGLCFGFSAMLAQAVVIQEEEKFFARLELIEHYKDKFDNLKSAIDQVKQKVIDKQEISLEEEQLLEILAFFEGIALYLDPYKFNYIFNKYLYQSNFDEVFPFASSQKLEKIGGNLSIVSNKSFAFNEEELTAYLSDLEDILGKSQSIYPIFLGSLNHSCITHYDKIKKKWIYVDTNLLEHNEAGDNGKYYLELNSKELSKFLFTSFSHVSEPYVLFNAKLVSNNPAFSDTHFLETLHSKHLMTTKHAARYDREGTGLLNIACGHGELGLVKRLLQHKTEIELNKANEQGIFPLYMACHQGHVEVVKELLQHSEINVNQATSQGFTPLFIACLTGNLESVTALLQRPEIDINKKTNSGLTLLQAAAHVSPEFKAIVTLYFNIKQMELYGRSLLSDDKEKGQVAITLAKDLMQKADNFFKISLKDGIKPKEFIQFSSEFKKLLHSKDAEMSTHRKLWKPIVANIFLALTGVGLLAIVIKSGINIIKSPTHVTLESCLFFNKTNRQEKIRRIEKSFQQVEEEAATPKKPGMA